MLKFKTLLLSLVLSISLLGIATVANAKYNNSNRFQVMETNASRIKKVLEQGRRSYNDEYANAKARQDALNRQRQQMQQNA